ncbi:hypothetical protein IC007_0467 [Sulfuracidifex tepidarius]|uniref:Uncharacterized protein n=1 Tax=Sulfuracidifex tepidarius TaxID=1294262 RepID=A0A510E0G3_9CREN|nr:hypothetical protein IC007_0467 [Sulfuracidifex tepidarius]
MTHFLYEVSHNEGQEIRDAIPRSIKTAKRTFMSRALFHHHS